MAKISETDERFVDHLEKLRNAEDRAALARLRRGLGKEPGTVADMHGLVLPWLPAGLPRRHEDACYLVAALFASHPQAGGAGTLGQSFARLAGATESDSVERRFVALLNCHEDELPALLRHAVSLLKSKEVPVNWRQLLYDVQHWSHPDRYVQRDWARDFWGGTFQTGQPATPQTAP
jgi:CRISPR system Cascade subunit CasB